MSAGACTRVRPATVDDATALARVQVHSCRSAYTGFFPPGHWDGVTVAGQRDDWVGRLRTPADDLVLVCDREGTGPIGYVLARCASWYGMDAQVRDLHVLPDHCRQGFGRELLRVAATELWARGCGPVGLATHEDNPVREWYDLIGGVPVADELQHGAGWSMRAVVYRFEVALELARRLTAGAAGVAERGRVGS